MTGSIATVKESEFVRSDDSFYPTGRSADAESRILVSRHAKFSWSCETRLLSRSLTDTKYRHRLYLRELYSLGRAVNAS